MKRVKIGLVGVGVQGSSYATIMANNDPEKGATCPEYVELAAYCDTDPAKLEAAKAKFGDKPCFTDYKEMITSGEVDAVINTLPHYFHPEVSIFAIENGVHVLNEKPAGVDAKSVAKMDAVAKAHPDIVYGIMLNQRTNKLYQKLKAIIDSGELGELRRSNWIINSWWRPTAYYQSSDWRASWGGEGGGVLVNQAPHQLDLFQWLTGVPKKVSAKIINGAHRDIAVDNDVTVTVEYENGATGVFITCTHDFIGTDRLELDFGKGKIVVDGSKVAKVYRMLKSEKQLDDETKPEDVMKMMMANAMGGEGEYYTIEEIVDDSKWGYQHQEVIGRFGQQIVTGEGLLATGYEGMMGVNFANAIHLSAWLGKEVELPVDQDLYLEELNKRIAAEGKFPVREA